MESPISNIFSSYTGIIYLIENIVNGKKYIGQTIKTFYQRYRKGRWWKYTNNPYLKAAFEKYGAAAFKITILEYSKDVEELNQLEAHYAKMLNTYSPNGYNLVQCGNNKAQHPDSVNKRSRTVVLNNPEGIDVTITNVRKFCRDNNLSNRSICRLLKGEFASVKGWSLKGVTDKHHRNNRAYTFYDRTGKRYDIIGLASFCKENNLVYHGMRSMCQGKLVQSQGYALTVEAFTKQRQRHIVTLIKGDEEITITNVKQQCKQYGLQPKDLYHLINGKIPCYKGWTVKSKTTTNIGHTTPYTKKTRKKSPMG